MALKESLTKVVEALLGISTYEPPENPYIPHIDDETVEAVRKALGGNLQPLPTTRLRWYIEDLESAQAAADAGNLRPAAQLYRAMRRDGTLIGLMTSRTKGLVRLPKRFYGNEKIADTLRSRNGSRGIFDEMFPPGELELLDSDGITLGVGVAELRPVKNRSYPVMVRLEPEFLYYQWNENRWYYSSTSGRLPIVPGDGKWILHIPGGRLSPWASGLWPALGRSFINKEHAIQYRSNYTSKLANPARLAYAPAGATELQRVGFFKRIMAWGVNSVFEMPPGWDAKLLESNGRGWEVFQKQIDTSDLEYMVAVAGQVVTTQGGMGFSNADVPAAIRQDLIQSDADALAYTINTQGLPQFIAAHFGINALYDQATIVEWDTGTSTDKERETRTLAQCADAIARLSVALAPYDMSVDVNEITTRFGIPSTKGAVLSVAPPTSESGEAGAGKLKTEALPSPSTEQAPATPPAKD